jgi:hypothetical protein
MNAWSAEKRPIIRVQFNSNLLAVETQTAIAVNSTRRELEEAWKSIGLREISAGGSITH